jgi:hypothetical protein
MRVVDEFILELTEEDVLAMEQHVLTESKGLFNVDPTKSSLTQKALGGLWGIGRAVAGGIGKVFKRVRQVSTRRTLNQLDKLTKEFTDDATRQIRQFYNRKLAGMRMRKSLRNHLMKASRNAFELGVKSAGTGGTLGQFRLTREQKRWLDDAVKSELGYFDNFINRVLSRSASEAEVRRRVGAYAAALKPLYYSGRMGTSPSNMAIDWVTALDRRVCGGCRFLQTQSPYTRMTLPTVPRAGDTPCLANCRCRLVMRPVKSEVLLQIQRKHKSKEWYKRQLFGIKKGRRTSSLVS